MLHLPRTLGLTAEMFARQVGKWLLGTATLTAGAGSAAAVDPSIDDMARALAQTYTESQRSNPSRCVEALIEWRQSKPRSDSPPREGMLAAHGGMRAQMLRAFLWLASDNGWFFNRRRITKDEMPPLRSNLRHQHQLANLG
jgi:hypothetical protein